MAEIVWGGGGWGGAECMCEHVISPPASVHTKAGGRSMAYTDCIVQLSSFPCQTVIHAHMLLSRSLFSN